MDDKDKLGRNIVGFNFDGTDSYQESHELSMKNSPSYKAVKARAKGKWGNILSHMDGLWHSEIGPDGCDKCTMYEDILYDAFEKINDLSFRELDDLATTHRTDMVDNSEHHAMKNSEIKKLKEALANAEAKIISLEEENDSLKVDGRISNQDIINMVESVLNINKPNQNKEKDNG